jgi:prepilin-type N-terminal cleavage/methylation domain-containing protein/prepilin-type processing-associated H-X9-DG protein
MSPHRRHGYSLIELLVAISIVALLVGLTLAAVQRVREAAKRADCQNRVRQAGLAVLNYESTTGRLPPGSISGPFEPLGVPSGAGHGLWAVVLPHLDQAHLGVRYRLDVSFDHPANRPVAAARIPVLECPTAPDRLDPTFGPADYGPVDVNPFLADIGVIDPGASFLSALPVNGTAKLTDITDGTSNTILVAEAAGRPGMAWASPDVTVGLREVFGRPHGLGANVCFADGSVHFVRESVGLRVLGKLCTRSGGEVIKPGEF